MRADSVRKNRMTFVVDNVAGVRVNREFSSAKAAKDFSDGVLDQKKLDAREATPTMHSDAAEHPVTKARREMYARSTQSTSRLDANVSGSTLRKRVIEMLQTMSADQLAHRSDDEVRQMVADLTAEEDDRARKTDATDDEGYYASRALHAEMQRRALARRARDLPRLDAGDEHPVAKARREHDERMANMWRGGR